MKRIEQGNELESAVAGKNAIVLFHSTWCPFCRAFRPVFAQATEGSELEVIEAVIDDEDDPLWDQHHIDVVPTVLFFENGKVVRRLDGRPGIGLRQAELDAALRGMS